MVIHGFIEGFQKLSIPELSKNKIKTNKKYNKFNF